MRASLMMTIVWPRTVMELIGPMHHLATGRSIESILSRLPTICILELQPVDPVLLSWRRKVCEITDDLLGWRSWRERGGWFCIIENVFN